MSRITSKLQVTIPKAVAQAFGLGPGSEITWVPAGRAIRVVPAGDADQAPGLAARLKLFDQATERQRRRQSVRSPRSAGSARGWTRDELYTRGRAR